MARKEGEKPLQISVTPKLMSDLKVAAARLEHLVPRKRLMDRGPMLAYVARWFAALSPEDQLGVILRGKEMAEQDVLDGAVELGKAAIGGVDLQNISSSTWGMHVPDPIGIASGVHAGDDVAKGLKGKKAAVRVKGDTPRRK